jgi:hypothetical protein
MLRCMRLICDEQPCIDLSTATGSPPNSSAWDSSGSSLRVATAAGMEGSVLPRRLKNVSCRADSVHRWAFSAMRHVEPDSAARV